MSQVGDKAPASNTLQDQNKKDVNLADLKSKKVLLSFHPLAWTPICAQQMLDLEKNYERFEKLNTVPVGISVDPLPSKMEWAKQIGISKTSLLIDFWPHGEVAKAYGLFREAEGFSERANIIIDENQNIVFFKIYEIDQLPDIEEVIKILESY